MKLDDLMPAYDVSATYSMRIAASPARVWEEVMHADFSQMPLARRLMTLRTLGRKKPSDKRHTLATMAESDAGGFKEIGRVPEKEIVLAIIGKFWRPDAPILRDWKPEEFATLAPAGYGKAAWNFHIEQDGDQTVVSTETRVLCHGRIERTLFRCYWTLIGFFSGLIRKEMLQMIKRNSEKPAAKLPYLSG
jgi:hypothetical protein